MSISLRACRPPVLPGPIEAGGEGCGRSRLGRAERGGRDLVESLLRGAQAIRLVGEAVSDVAIEEGTFRLCGEQGLEDGLGHGEVAVGCATAELEVEGGVDGVRNPSTCPSRAWESWSSA